nr:myosin heavy chain, clone 203-like isoform X2 [Cherax quadricarinatus]
MLQNRRLRRYQRFLKTLRRPQSNFCSCPSHLHPRPWVHPPCRTTRPFKEEDSLSRRTCSSPDLVANTRQSFKMDKTQSRWESDDQHHQNSLQHLYNDARILKEAFRKIHHGDHLSKDMCNTVKKWSKKEIPNSRNKVERNRRERQKLADHREPAEDADNRSSAQLAQEEEALRQELRNLRELTQSNASVVEENKRLMRKVHQLQQRLRRQETVQKGSGGTEKNTESRDEYVILALRKKYEDLLQYVLKVESENQKLKSLIGVSGEQEDIFNCSDHEHGEYGPRVLARLHNDLEALKQEILKKDEYILECEQHLQTMKENVDRHNTLRNQTSGARTIDTSTLEEEWMRRLNETRDMYDRAIQGYKDQLGELQEKLLNSEKNHAKQVTELTSKLAEAQSEVIAPKANEVEIDESHRPININGDKEKDKKNEKVERQRSEETEESDQSGFEETEKQEKTSEPKRPDDKEHRKNDNTKRNGENVSRLEKSSQSSSTAKSQNKDTETTSETPEVIRFERYSESIENLVKRLESSSLGRDEIENITSVIKDTVSECLNEWKGSLRQELTQEKDDTDKLKKEYEDLQKKLRSKNKKIESLQNQCKDFEQQNLKLHHQYSQLELRMDASQITGQLDVLQELPKKLQETEQRLLDTRELFQQAQGEKQALQDQLHVLEEKLSKKETKLKSEREQCSSREKEIKNLRETSSSLQRQLEDAAKEASHLQEQMSTKDTILEHTSTQLEERIRECATLSSLVDHYKIQQNQESNRIQAQLCERESASYQQYMEAQALATRCQAQLSALRSEKDHNEKSLRNNVRKLEEQVDQLQLKNSTLQRQLTIITSTYHNMFSSVDLNLPSSPGLGSSDAKNL